MTTKELHESIVSTMKTWQKVEDVSVSSTGQVIEKTSNPVIRMIMEIIQHDSQRHYRVQQMIIDTFEREAVTLQPEELAEIWEMIERHIEIEKRTVELASQALEAIKNRKLVVQEYLIHYLLDDEEKHNKMLTSLSMIKKGMYPYG